MRLEDLSGACCLGCNGVCGSDRARDASFTVSVWQASLRLTEFRNKQKARIAVDPGEIHSEPEYWEAQLWLTNVGQSRARRASGWKTRLASRCATSIFCRDPSCWAGKASPFGYEYRATVDPVSSQGRFENGATAGT